MVFSFFSQKQPASRALLLPGQPAYLPGINNLRALAALIVCLGHFTGGALPQRELIPAAAAFFLPGKLGVDIFFVLSGFVIPYSLLRQGYRLAGFSTYFWRRVVRLGPPAYAAMLLTIEQWVVAGRLFHGNAYYFNGLTWARVLHNLLFTVPFSHTYWFVDACWTLATEFQFYIFLGLFFPVLFAGRQAWGLVVVFVGLSFLGRVAALAPATFFVNSSLFALGGATLLWQQRRIGEAAFAGCLALFSGLAYSALGPSEAVTGFATVLAILLVTNRIPFLNYVGTISYSLYLTHVLAGTSTEFILVHLIAPATAGRRALIIGLCLAAALLIAALFYRWVERPFIRLAARIR